MSHSLDNTIHQPRRRPAPSPRNLQIYLDYQVAGISQSDLAKQYGLTQCRISQIVRRIEAWRSVGCVESGTDAQRWSADVTHQAFPLGSASPALPTSPSPSRDDLVLRLGQERLNLVSREAIRHFNQPQVTTTHKKGTRGDKSTDETTTRTHTPNLQCLKIILQANAQQQRLSRLHSPSPPRPLSSADLNPEPRTLPTPLSRDAVESWLTDQIDATRHNGKTSFQAHDSNAIVNDLVSHLLGEPSKGTCLHALAEIAGKKLVDLRSYEQSRPEVPPIDGWYYGMYDSSGHLVTWLHASLFADHLPPDRQPDLYCKGANKLPPNTSLKADIPPDYPPVSADSLSPPTPNSESQATADQPNTDPLLTPISTTCAPSTNSPQPQPSPALTSETPKTKTSYPVSSPFPPSSPNASSNTFSTPISHPTSTSYTQHPQIASPQLTTGH